MIDLLTHPRRVLPEDLKGKAKANWNDLITGYTTGNLSHVPQVKMWEWACDHCGLTIGITAFKDRLKKARRANGKKGN